MSDRGVRMFILDNIVSVFMAFLVIKREKSAHFLDGQNVDHCTKIYSTNFVDNMLGTD